MWGPSVEMHNLWETFHIQTTAPGTLPVSYAPSPSPVFTVTDPGLASFESLLQTSPWPLWSQIQICTSDSIILSAPGAQFQWPLSPWGFASRAACPSSLWMNAGCCKVTASALRRGCMGTAHMNSWRWADQATSSQGTTPASFPKDTQLLKTPLSSKFFDQLSQLRKEAGDNVPCSVLAQSNLCLLIQFTQEDLGLGWVC